MIIPVTITDLTQMGGQRVCLAGYLPDGTCVRPMFQSDFLNKNWLKEGNKAIIRPFSVVEFDFKNERTFSPPHTEDRYILPTHRLNCGMLNYDQQKGLLQKIDDIKVSSIFGAEIHTDPGWYVRAGEGQRSLGTINAPKIEEIVYRPLSSGWDYRISFTDIGGDGYRLAVTDLTFRYFLDNLYFREGMTPSEASRHLKEKLQKSQLFFRIGLSRNWDKYPDRCFLQINGIFSFPDYLEGRNFSELELPGNLLIKRNKIVSNIYSHKVQKSEPIHDIYENLKRYFGYGSFRYPQEEIIKDVLAGRDVFVLMPTAGGKSLCYQLPATILNGLTIIVSPLVSLMKDQVDYLNKIGIPASCLKSGQSSEEKVKIRKELLRYDVKLLYISPEKITQAAFLRFLGKLTVSLFAIDEAHCICEWGPQFRPEYSELSILKEIYPETPIIALTATATPDEVKDIIKQLHLSNAKEYKKSFNRENLTYEVRPKYNEYDQLRDYLNNHKNDSGIIYCLSKWKTENLAEKLQDDGFQAKPFHSEIGEKIKNFTQEKFMNGEIRIIVATTAFGMGIDKPNVRFVIHLDLPFSVEDYYQQTGRAGRDGGESECILFFNYEDKQRILRLIKSDPRFQVVYLK